MRIGKGLAVEVVLAEGVSVFKFGSHPTVAWPHSRAPLVLPRNIRSPAVSARPDKISAVSG
jgi:hypothetical protein